MDWMKIHMTETWWYLVSTHSYYHPRTPGTAEIHGSSLYPVPYIYSTNNPFWVCHWCLFTYPAHLFCLNTMSQPMIDEPLVSPVTMESMTQLESLAPLVPLTLSVTITIYQFYVTFRYHSTGDVSYYTWYPKIYSEYRYSGFYGN